MKSQVLCIMKYVVTLLLYLPEESIWVQSYWVTLMSHTRDVVVDPPMLKFTLWHPSDGVVSKITEMQKKIMHFFYNTNSSLALTVISLVVATNYRRSYSSWCCNGHLIRETITKVCTYSVYSSSCAGCSSYHSSKSEGLRKYN